VIHVKPETGLLIITHGQIGQTLINVAEFILDQSLTNIQVISYHQTDAGEMENGEISAAINKLDTGQGVLVMADLGGASPFNNVKKLLPDSNMALVSGLNLAMLIRVWNYRKKSLPQLAKLATEGGIRDIRQFDQ
jgi:PTS system mannose-specific IIA component